MGDGLTLKVRQGVVTRAGSRKAAPPPNLCAIGATSAPSPPPPFETRDNPAIKVLRHIGFSDVISEQIEFLKFPYFRIQGVTHEVSTIEVLYNRVETRIG